jgi:hypothetical protein
MLLREAADAAKDLAAHGALDRGLDAVDERIARFDVDACVAVRRAAGRALGHIVLLRGVGPRF